MAPFPTSLLARNIAMPRRFLLGAPVTLALLLCSLAAFFSPQLSTALQWDREAIAAGEIWRVITGHFVHWDGEHLFWDAAMFAVLGCLLEIRYRRAFLACLGSAALAISAAIWIFQPELATYRGLSGLDTALFAMLAADLLLESRRGAERSLRAVALPALLLIGLLAKIAYEFIAGTTIFVDAAASGFTPVPLAHLVGALAGLATPVYSQHRKPVSPPLP
jgi:rhomboid family GlyGly-CTERM serine protease